MEVASRNHQQVVVSVRLSTEKCRKISLLLKKTQGDVHFCCQSLSNSVLETGDSKDQHDVSRKSVGRPQTRDSPSLWRLSSCSPSVRPFPCNPLVHSGVHLYFPRPPVRPSQFLFWRQHLFWSLSHCFLWRPNHNEVITPQLQRAKSDACLTATLR